MKDWRDEIHEVLSEAGIRQVAYLPDAGHSKLLELCEKDNRMRMIPMANEFEAIGIAAGAWLGGEKSVVLIQSSGVGNCINALSLSAVAQYPLLMIVAMRGEFGEGQRWQIPMGQAVRPTLEAMGVICYEARHADEVRSIVDNAATFAFQAHNRVAILLSQQLIGAKKFTN
ncbi:MAG TPA: thiamine pyrophosphate-binding protein [Hyphomicrobiaceae bacterium]|nr:thiamine pyrophosphate-binding protein [Hyphomicrobiaceae bacterium]